MIKTQKVQCIWCKKSITAVFNFEEWTCDCETCSDSFILGQTIEDKIIPENVVSLEDVKKNPVSRRARKYRSAS